MKWGRNLKGRAKDKEDKADGKTAARATVVNGQVKAADNGVAVREAEARVDNKAEA